jgi:hypothetical protein
MGYNYAIMAILATIILIMTAGMVHAKEPINVDKLANAIYIAEGGSKTRHPYGILKRYKVTTPRQACINTINSNYKRWVKAGKRGDFIEYLGRTYCPIGAKNDPTGLNKNWVKNVRYHYERII